ncbi:MULTISPECIES: hypothetical protein [Nocardiaceae]|uniref:Type II secretory pathway pseudopilin PulG n=1 Tax=Rhodococcoides corynebacterioides TaxID=53972 RepID=A0ABS2KT55_9NOCA|nr:MULTISPECIES: hypothetical protein [Rhodococcus]MBM7415133.1 type II secretory pathway pseudopilin PulG [Rhodococcus corynebacterioides]MBP1117595.1 type II secretory pathway pseudopilin PulG [Rhodococcus sp. PvP016]
MSVPVDVTGSDGSRRAGSSLETVRAPRPPARTGAAKRAYDKRRQRAMSHESDPRAHRPTRSVAARIPFVASIIGLLAIGLASTLLLSTRAAEDSYLLSAGRAANQELTERAAALQRDVETANSAPELARRATAQGMIPTKDVPRLVVLPDGVVQVIGTPAPAAGPPAPDFAAATPSGGAATPSARPGTPASGGEALTPVGRPGASSSASPTPTTSAPAASTTPAPTTSAPAAPTTTPVPANAAPQPLPAPAAAVGEQQVPIAGGAR